MNPSIQLKIIRGLDGVFLASLSIIVMIFHPSLGRDELGVVNLICVAPIAVIAWFIYQLPPQLDSIKNWQNVIVNLRIFTFGFALLSPFLVWWNKIPDNMYLLINSQLAALAGIGFIFNLNRLIQELTIFSGHKSMEWESRFIKLVIFYSMLIPLIAILLTYTIDSLITSGNAFKDYHTILSITPKWFRAIIIAPVILTFSLLYRIRHFLARQFDLTVTNCSLSL